MAVRRWLIVTNDALLFITGYISNFHRAFKNVIVFPSFLPHWQDLIINTFWTATLSCYFFAERANIQFFQFCLFNSVNMSKPPSLLKDTFFLQFQQQEMSATANSISVSRVTGELDQRNPNRMRQVISPS